MSIESGTFSFRAFRFSGTPPAVTAFARHALPPLDTLSDGQITGWVTGRHDADRNITPDTAIRCGMLRLSYVRAFKRIPPSLLRVEYNMERLARMKADGVERLSSRARSEILASCRERLLAHAQPVLQSIPMVICGQYVYAGAVSATQADLFTVAFVTATGLQLERVAFDENLRDCAPVSFADGVSPEAVLNDHGCDFLTWLLYRSQQRNGVLGRYHDDVGADVMVEPTFQLAGPQPQLAERLAIKGELAGRSAELAAALASGKKLTRAKVSFALRGNGHVYSCVLSSGACVRGLRVPDSEALDPESLFEDRILKFCTFVVTLETAHKEFVALRTSPRDCERELSEIRAWVNSMRGAQ